MAYADREEKDRMLLYAKIDELQSHNDVLSQKNEELQERLARIENELFLSNELSSRFVKALAFAASAIKCGEKWTETCEEVIGTLLNQQYEKRNKIKSGT